MDQSSEFKELVRARTDLVELIGESVGLRSLHGGREYVGLCPFHDDHNPSLHVYPDRQSYRCWVCQAGGDCFSFVMEEARVGFREALELLARRAGLELPARRERSREGSSQKPQVLEALHWAQGQFHDALVNSPAGRRALDYLRGRGFTDDTIRHFRLGYHPDDWEWLQRRAGQQFSPQILLEARLIGEREAKRPGDRVSYYDNFKNRVLFPICNERGQTVAFGGRVLPGDDDSRGKYWNSPESIVFHKSRTVYALDVARKSIIDTKTVLVTEGYTDCIAAHQAGVTNVVATLGTALTDQHVTTLKRFARKVVLVYDGDEAGQDAAARSVERFLAQDVDLRILTLSAGQDLADFITEQGPNALRERIEHSVEGWEFKFQAALRQYGLDSVDGRQRVLDEMLELLRAAPRMSEHVREGLLLSDLAQRLGLSDEAVRSRYREIRVQAAQRRPTPVEPSRQVHPDVARILSGKASTEDRYELAVLEVFLSKPSLVSFLQGELSPEAFKNRVLRRVYEIGLEFASSTPQPTFEGLLGQVEHPDYKRLVVWIDDQARLKGLHAQLQEMETEPSCPLFLRRSVDNLVWRREEQSQMQAAVQFTAAGEGSRGLDEEAERLLREASEFHTRRATRKTPV